MTKKSIDNNRLQGWVVKVFKLPKGTGVTASERECNGEQHSSIVTDVTVHLDKDHTQHVNKNTFSQSGQIPRNKIFLAIF